MLRFKPILASAAAAAAASILSLTINPATASASNTYPYGQCTYYAKSARPDIGNHWGNAHNWDNVARSRGYPVSSRPQVGDVVVFERYTQGNSPYGHVGIVTAVSGNRFKTVSMWGNEATGRIHVDWHHTGGGVSFIHKPSQIVALTKTTAPAKKTAPAKATVKKTAPAASAKKTAPAHATAKKRAMVSSTKKTTTAKAPAKKPAPATSIKRTTAAPATAKKAAATKPTTKQATTKATHPAKTKPTAPAKGKKK